MGNSEKDIPRQLLNLFGENGEHWGKFYTCVDSLGNLVSPWEDEATKWCLIGACIKLNIPRIALYRIFGTSSIASFNDKHEWHEIKKILMEAEGHENASTSTASNTN